MHGNRQERWFDAMSGNVDHVHQQVIVVDPVVVETVTTELLRRQIARRHGYLAGEAARHDRLHIVSGPGEFRRHLVALPSELARQDQVAFFGVNRSGDVDDL